MKLGILLSPGDSLEKQQKSGQLERLINYYLKPYVAAFEKVFVFSYGDHNFSSSLPFGVKLITKPWPKKIIEQVSLFRVFQAVGGLPAVLTGKPFVVTYGYDYPGFAFIEGKWLTAAMMKLILPLVLFRSKKIIITAKESLRFLKLWQGKAVLIPNGVDPEVFKPGGNRDPWLVLSVGRLVKQKNYQLLIETVAHSEYREKIKLVIIGKGPLKEELLTLAKAKKVNLKIVDSMPHSKLVSWYKKAGIFVLTSLIEGQSKVLLEALSCGCACLTTTFSGNPLIGVKPENLTGELDRLLSDDKLRLSLGEKGRELVKNNFNLPKLIKKEISLLKSCV